MKSGFYAFGEMLWDCLPSGQHAGGAPLNVCAHLAHLGKATNLISAVGQDMLGDELLALADAKGINTRFVTRAPDGLATGTVQVTLDTNSNASYEIVEPVAWDKIAASEDAACAVAASEAIVFGSLAARSPYNLSQLGRLLNASGPLKCFDVNLRAPFADLTRVLLLARQANLVKLNDEELGLLAAWIDGTSAAQTPQSHAAIAACCAALARAASVSQICVTRGALGAAFWDRGILTSASAPPTQVKDTVGAGDAFMAGLVVGLTRGIDMQQTLTAACRLGAYVASQDGATPRLPKEIVASLGEP